MSRAGVCRIKDVYEGSAGMGMPQPGIGGQGLVARERLIRIVDLGPGQYWNWV